MTTRSPRVPPSFHPLGYIGEPTTAQQWQQPYRPWDDPPAGTDVERMAANAQHTYWVGEADIDADIVTVTAKLQTIPDGYEIVLCGTKAGTGYYNPLGVNTPVVVFPVLTLLAVTQPRTMTFAVMLTAMDATCVAPVPAGLLTPYTYTDFEDVAVGDYDIATAPKIQYALQLQPDRR